jgi:hypothetical protein
LNQRDRNLPETNWRRAAEAKGAFVARMTAQAIAEGYPLP